MSSAQITIYGDSITKGVLMEGGRYLINSTGLAALAQRFSLLIRNRSKFGCTIDKGLARMHHDLDGQTAPNGVTVLEYGGNDCDFDWAAVAADPDAVGILAARAVEEAICRGVRAAESLHGRPAIRDLPFGKDKNS